MSAQFKRLIFDECLGRNVIPHLLPLVSSDIEVCHMTTRFPQGTLDQNWVPILGLEGGWVVVTADRGKNSTVGDKLPDLCAEHLVSHIILSSKLHNKTSKEKIAWIAAVWSRVERVFDSPAGSRYSMRLKSKTNEESIGTDTIDLVKLNVVSMAELAIERIAKRKAYQERNAATQS